MTARSFDGCSKAERKPFRTTPKYLATIDFGTTHCSVAYLHRPDRAPNPSEVDPNLLKLDNAGNRRVPSCILFDSNGEKLAFGHEAREQFIAVEHKLRPKYHYFEHVKRHLQHEQNVDRNQKILAMNGKQFFLVDVIAHILHHLKHQLLTVLRDLGKELRASEIDWVITVPAIWKSKGKKMMREAGYMAGLCSDSNPEPIHVATAHENHSPPQEEKSPEKLSLALEPESAAIHCQRKATEAGRAPEYIMRPQSYIVIDIGGGTVDIASHSIVGSRIEEIAASAGNFCGGTTVNEEFSKFLQKFVDDPKFSRYVQSGTVEEQTQHKADLNRLLYGNTGFESQKMRFGSGEGQNSYYFEFPHSFWRLYKDSILKRGQQLSSKEGVQVDDEGAVMRINDSKMAEFFQPAIDGIVNLIESHLQENKGARTTDTICWVGGFGGCKYLRNELQRIINTYFRGFGFHFPVPPEPELAVIRGATAFRCDPGIVAKRKADATYGVKGCNVVFKGSDKMQDQPLKSNTFHAFVKRGQDISTNKVFVMNFTASEINQPSATFLIYSTFWKDEKYITDDNIHQLGEVTVQLGGDGLNRAIELVLDITHTEIHIRARDTTSHNEQKVVVDFLSSRNEKARTSTFKDVSTAHSQTSVRPSEHMEIPHKGAVQTPQKNKPENYQALPMPTDTVGAVQTLRKEYSQTLPMCTDTLDMPDLVDITGYLHEMEKSQIHELGLVLGLSHTNLKKMDPSTFLNDVIAAWLRQEDWVKMCGEPSWMVLIKALKLPRVGQMGIAAKIAKRRGLQDN